MALLKHPYELSVWDILPEEKKIAIIGSNTMTSPIRAIDPILVRNVNGTVTLTFKMYTRYFDEDKEQITENPFLSMLMVERTLKLKYKDKWYDLVIKNRQESSDQKMYSYTAKSAHICELSKTGFDLEFKTELQNNQGAVTELGRRVMEGTDWEIGSSDIVRAYQDDQLILFQTSSELSGVKMLDKTSVSVGANKQFYAFYTDWKAFQEEEKELQILLVEYFEIADGKNLDDLILDGEYYDDNGILTIGDNVLVQYSTETKNKIVKIGTSNYRGRRLVKKQKTRFNATLDRYVNIYTSGETNKDGSFKEDIEGYSKTEFLSPNFVENLIVNSKDFESTAGWYGKIEDKKDDKGNTTQYQPTVELDYYPPISQETSWKEATITSRLKITPKTTSIGNKVYNTGLRSNFSKIEDFAAGEQLLLCYNFVNENNEVLSKSDLANANVTFSINGFTSSSFDENEIGEISREDIPKQIFTAINKITKEELKEAQFTITFKGAGPYYLKDISLFRYVKGNITEKKENEDGTVTEKKYEDIIIYPGDVPDNKPIVTNFYYYVEENASNKAEEYAYLNNDKIYAPIYNDANYEKIASIEKSESNRFNLIQELCETFECWADFVIEHDPNGKVLSKTIYFKEYIGENRHTGFKYGINLKSIQRVIDSEQIATKIIVKPNSNEHGENGFCTIARATENPLGGTYLLNFDYYVNQGLLKKEDLDNDLYIKFIFLDKDGNEKYDKGFYDLMYEKSRRRDEIIAERTAFSASYLEGIAAKNVADETLQSTEQLLSDLKQQYKQYSGVEWPNISPKHREGEKADGKIADNEIYKFITKIQQAQSMRDNAEADATKYEDYTEENYEAELKSYNERVQELKIEELEDDFFNKYHNFIQEGTWNSEEYWDDNEYYIDALDVTRTSSRPKVTYTINVIDVSVLDDYEGYEFDVGDKTFMEDPEFFGYVFYEKDGESHKKPYKEEVVITEISEHLEAPEANQIKVQNYKTQFDDLFQRITAQTQSLQYASGGYNRASAAINSDGTIDGELLQNSLLNYALALMNPENKGVIWDRDGIRIIDRENTNKILKLTGGALQISNDGGNTWAIAVNGNGINAGLVTTGSINTEEIMIGNSENFSFRWDASGLNAYTRNDDESYNYGKFVRFDQYGLYGYSKGTVFNPSDLNEVKNNADFGLTWDGFFLKSKAREGWIEIDSENDFRVLIGTPNDYKEKIKIGEISKGVFGITIKDAAGDDAFYTDDNGDLTVIGHIEASSGNIGGWYIGADLAGNTVLSSVQSMDGNINSGIILNANASSMYSASFVDSLGSTGWSIQENDAYFNNITLRGALKCAVLEYAEVSAVGGILMVRPATSIKELVKEEGQSWIYVQFSFYDDEDRLWQILELKALKLKVENSAFFQERTYQTGIFPDPDLSKYEIQGDFCKLTTEAKDDILKSNNGQVVLYSGINTNLFECLKVDSQYVYLNVDHLSDEEIDELAKSFAFEGLGLVNLGSVGKNNQDGSIGLGLNSSTNSAMLPPESFSVFTFEESKYSGTSGWKYLKPHIILGKIPNDPIYGAVAGQYGLYADAAEITGAIHATSISTVDTSGKRTKIPIGSDGMFSQNAVSGLGNSLKALEDSIGSLQDQIDGVIDTWYYSGVPTLDNEPAINWQTVEQKQEHLGDLYYDEETNLCYRFMKEGTDYKWALLEDNALASVLEKLAETNAALDDKVSTFIEQEEVVTPEIVPEAAREGDLLFSTDGKIYILVLNGTKLEWKLQMEPVTPIGEIYEYAQTNSGKVPPSSWSTTRPAPEQGKYLWTKTTITYSDNSTSESYTVAYQGVDGVEGPQGPQGLQGDKGETGASITSVTTQYATVTKGANAPAESSNSWKDTSPTTYSSSNDYYYRYKQIYSNGDIKYTSPSNWFNPYSVKNGAVLEFDSNGYVVRELLKGLTWSYVASQNTTEMPSSPDHTRGEDKELVIVQFDGSDKTYVLSYDNLAVHTNILAEGTIISSNGLIGGWTINDTGLFYSFNSYEYCLSPTGKQGEINGKKGNFVFYAKSNNGEFGVGLSGKLFAKGAEIAGKITADEGVIGGCEITDGKLIIESANIKSLAVNKILGGTNSKNITFNGKIIAPNIEATGNIVATSGQFGGLEIGKKEQQINNKEVDVLLGYDNDKIYQTVLSPQGYLTSVEQEELLSIFSIWSDNPNQKNFTYGDVCEIQKDTFTGTITSAALFGAPNYLKTNGIAKDDTGVEEEKGRWGNFAYYCKGGSNTEGYIWTTPYPIEPNTVYTLAFVTKTGTTTSVSDIRIYGATAEFEDELLDISNETQNLGTIDSYSTEGRWITKKLTFTTPSFSTESGSGYIYFRITLPINSPSSLRINKIRLIKGTSENTQQFIIGCPGFSKSTSTSLLDSYLQVGQIISGGILTSHINDNPIFALGASLTIEGAKINIGHNSILFKTVGKLNGDWVLNEASIQVSSDRQLKNSIEKYTLEYSLLFDELNPVRYKYNNGTSNRYHTGFIAQEVEEAILKSGLTTQDFAGFTRAIETEINPTTGKEIQVECCYLRYEEFIALNTNEIQKLKKRVTELETKLAELLNQQN